MWLDDVFDVVSDVLDYVALLFGIPKG